MKTADEKEKLYLSLQRLTENTIEDIVNRSVNHKNMNNSNDLNINNKYKVLFVCLGDFDRGDYKIIGHSPLEDSELSPIESFGLMNNPKNQKCYLLYGTQYFERPQLPSGIYKSYSNEAVRFTMKFNEKMLKSCIDVDSNLPYWKESPFYKKMDLRNPKNAEARAIILKHFGIEDRR